MDCSSKYLIVRPENGGVLDLFRFLVFHNQDCGAKFLEFGSVARNAAATSDRPVIGGGEVTPDHRWVIVVSVIVRKILKVVGKPMEFFGYGVEFFLNLLFLNGDTVLSLLSRILQGNVTMPERGSETFISAIGHLDERMDLCKGESSVSAGDVSQPMGDRARMDLCMLASKLAYENAKVVRNVVERHWKMCFVDFYNCWNEYQKEMSTQVFIMCDKPKNANLILISFRGTEPFDADDWITDFDYSWYEIPKLGKVHMGFLEALGLGNRVNTSSFRNQLQASPQNHPNSNGTAKEEAVPKTAYYAVRMKLKELLKKHENAKFVVTGHSLGGALAIMFPTVLVLHEEEEMMERLLGVYTYGQPRIGDRQLGKFMESHLESKYFRVVYCNDLVPRLPYDNKTFLYKHFGICQYYNSLYLEQNVEEEPNRNYFGMRYFIPEYMNAGWELLRSFLVSYIYGSGYKESWESFMLRVLGLAIPGLAAHSPVEYVNSIRLGTRLD